MLWEKLSGSLLCSLVIPALLGGLIYWNTLHAEFAYDDNRAILDNQDLRPERPLYQLWLNDFWGTRLTSPGSHKSFRPLCVATFRFNYFLHGLAPAGYHAVNVGLHMLAVVLFGQVIRKITGNCQLASLAGLAFAVHPIHTEAVAGVVGRADVGACVFFLLSFLAYIHYCHVRDQVVSSSAGRQIAPNLLTKQPLWMAVKSGEIIPASLMHQQLKWLLLIATCVCALVSCLFKETGITVLGVCIVYDVVVIQGFRSLHELNTSLTHKSHSKRLEGVLCLLGFAGAAVGMRMALMGNKPPEFAESDNPAASCRSWLARSLTFLYLPVVNFKMMLFPLVLSYDWSMDAVPLVTTLFDRRNLLSIGFYTGVFLFVRRISGISVKGITLDKTMDQPNISIPLQSRNHRLILALALCVVPFLPACNLFFYVGFVLAERILYIPSMGFSWMVAEGLIKTCNHTRKSPWQRRALAGGFCVLLFVHSGRTWLRNRDWLSEERLYLAGAAINPAKSWSNLGNIWSQRGKLREAEVAYITALRHRSNMADAHYNLGILLQDQRRVNESIASYRKAINFRHNMAVAYLNLGIALQSIGRQRDAEEQYRWCSQLDVSNLKDPKLHETAKITCLFNLGRLLADEHQFQSAVSVYRDAVNRMPPFYAPQSLYNMLGEAYFHLNRSDLAEYWYKMALQAKPDHVPAHLTYARFLYKQNRTTAAEQIFSAVFQAAPNDSSVYHFYGQYLMDSGRLEQGMRVMLKAAEMYPNDFQSLTNAAGALRQSGDNIKSEYLYRRAAQVDVFQVSGHINLGAILHVNGKLEEAEKAYLGALQLDPVNAIATDNLHKLRNLMRRQREDELMRQQLGRG